ncbi:MAG: hypothetical protein LBE91_19015 [Tannerella sp.]|jgi:hypothetical protein|nr:hypothetical protein [Tannerella sp.]
MNNLALYNAVREVPKEAQKSFDNGRFKGTDINPMWRIKTLTEQFGVCGFGWYYEITSQRLQEGAEGNICAFTDINLYVKTEEGWSKPIPGIGGNSFVSKTKNGLLTSDEAFKMSLSDAISVAAKALGVGADIYYQNDRTKYTMDDKSQQSPRPQPQSQPQQSKQEEFDLTHLSLAKQEVKETKNETELTEVWNRWSMYKNIPEFRDFVIEQRKKVA